MPGSKEAHQAFVWADPEGNPRPPPPEVVKEGRYDGGGVDGVMEMRILESDERRLDLQMEESGRRPLGLMIRGGKEYCLGIYVTRVDAGSPAGEAGLRVGDQILDVDGTSFFDITHPDACAALKRNDKPSSLKIAIKSVGCIPKGKANTEQQQMQQQQQNSLDSPAHVERKSRDTSVRSSPHNSISQASATSIESSASAAEAAAAAAAATGKAPVNRRTRSASPLAQLSHLAARLPTPSTIKLKRKQKKQKDNQIEVNDGQNGDASSRSSSLQRPGSSPLIVNTNVATSSPFQNPRKLSGDAIASNPASGDASPIFHRGLGSQMNLTLERGTVLARTRDAIVEQSRAKLDNDEHRTLNYYLEE